MRSPTEFSLPVSAQHEPVGNDRVPTIRFEEQTKYIKGENTMKGTFKKAVALGSAIPLWADSPLADPARATAPPN